MVGALAVVGGRASSSGFAATTVFSDEFVVTGVSGLSSTAVATGKDEFAPESIAGGGVSSEVVCTVAQVSNCRPEEICSVALVSRCRSEAI